MTVPFARPWVLAACFALLGVPAAAPAAARAQETVLTFDRFTQVARHDPKGRGARKSVV